jgi:steroid delta-isomerase-like uncharacterized protein
MDTSQGNRELVERFVAAANARDWGALEAVVAADVVRHCPATPDVRVRGFHDLRRFLEQDAVTFPDNHVAIDELVAEGDRVAFWATYSGTQAGPMGSFAPTGRRMECEFSGIFRIEDGRIAHVRLTWDNLSVLGQLGHLPAQGAR